ncbi:hypothetical protein MHU86_2832 [Fragilaria crotonensis]|nr:hypothetical protein MHU86_2832 [Fragilaria crotonensis]
MSLQAKLSRKIENAGKRNAKMVLMLSPAKEQYVVTGPMGLSRHFSSCPQCSLDHSGDPRLLGGMMMNDAQSGECHPVSTFCCAGGSSYVPPRWNSDAYVRLPDDDEDLGTSTFSDLDDDREMTLFTDAVNATLNNKESEHPDSSNVALLSSDNSDSPPLFPNTFGDAWSKRDDDDGLNLSTFSLEEEV